MLCDKSENCIFYRTYRYKPNFKQNRLLVESYCEGRLQKSCRRNQYEQALCKEAPEELAPNGYIIGTHNKLRVENTRKYLRHKVKNGMCLLQTLGTEKTFSAWIVDISEGGMRLELKSPLEELEDFSEQSFLKILGYDLEETPVPITRDLVKMVWQNNQAIGCCFADSLQSG